MSLRDLAIDIAFNSEVNKVMAMNSAVDEVKSSAIDAAGGIDQMADSTESLGGKSSILQTLEQNWLAITAAGVAAGTAIETMARKQAPLTEQTNRLAASLEMTSDEVRDLARETSNVTFPLEDVLNIMETGRQQGIKSAEALREYATFWDTVGDATGESATKLAESSAGLRAVGIAAGEEKEALAAFGYITENTTGDVQELLQFLQMTGPQLRELGMDVNDTAAIMGALEHELGMTSRMARSEFKKAVNEADGDLGEMLRTLGLTEEQFKTYQEAVAGSSDIIQRNADLHGDNYTMMQKLQHGASELVYQYGDLIGAASMLTPLLLGLGPAMQLATGAKWLFNAALWASPITWLVIGIIGLIAVVALLWANWDKVSNWMGEKWDWVKEKVGGVVDWFTELPGEMLSIGSDIISGLINGFKQKYNDLKNTVSDMASSVAGGFKSFFGIKSPSRLMMEYGENITAGLQIGMDNSPAEIPTPGMTTVSGGTNAIFAPKVEIIVNGGGSQAGESVRQELEAYFPKLMDDFFRQLQAKRPAPQGV